jgi:hypothetical protein
MSEELPGPRSMLEAIIGEMNSQIDSDSDEEARVTPMSIRMTRRVLIPRRIARHMVRRTLFVEERLFEEDTAIAIRMSMRDYKPHTTTTTKENIDKICPEIKARHQKDKCTVCLEHVKRGEPIRMLPCHHYLHSDCLVGWFTQGNTVCPVCRYEVKFET